MRRRILGLFLILFGLFQTYLALRVLAPLRVWPGTFWPFTLTFLIGLLAMLWLPLVYWASTDSAVKRHEQVLEKIAHIAMGLISLLFFFVLARDLALGVLALTDRQGALAALSASFRGPAASVVLVAATALAGWIGYCVARLGPVVRKVELLGDVASPRLRIVQISDLHVGSWIKRAYVEKAVARILALGPIDLLVLTGDIGDGDPNAHVDDLAPLGRIPARIGKFAVTGNHEGYWSESAWNARVRDLGFRILENEGIFLETAAGKISIHGVSDANADPVRAFANLRPEVYSIFLAHQPKHAAAAIAAGIRLQLSGHTHAGQFLPWSALIGLFHRFAKGLYQVGPTAIYVNAGTGFWGPPFRLGTRSETTLIELSPR